MAKAEERGFVLPLAVFLVFLLSVSGASFFQLHFLEWRAAQHEVDNHGAFYLANTGIERARETLKIPPDQTWTTVLKGTYDGNGDGKPDYPLDPNPSPPICATCLCGPDPGRGCVIPFLSSASVPDPVITPGLPFDSLFDSGQYQVRAFNNEPGTTDTDQTLNFRALGFVRGQQKLIEVKGVRAFTGSKLINCQNTDPSQPCPDSANKNTDFQFMSGRDPASLTTLPEFVPNAYRFGDPSQVNLPCSSQVKVIGDMTLVDKKSGLKAGEVQIQSGTCYYATGGDIVVSSVGSGWTNVVIFSDHNLSLNNTSGFNKSILIGLTGININGNFTIDSPRTQTAIYPALVTTGTITGSNNSITVDGNIYAATDKIDDPTAPKTGSVGVDKKPLNPNGVTGTIFGDNVYLKSGAQLVSDNNAPIYYSLMPGFKYPPELLTNQVTGPNSWSEIE